jgi:GNAT superfamily N-acetyltransferase
MNILVRAFEEADRDTLRLLYVASRNATFTWNAVELHQAIDFDAHTEGERILVAVVDADILGFASIWEADSFLHNLFVHPSATRKGVGQALLSGCAKYFTITPTLKCLKANVNATQFYKSQGWQTLREETGPDGPYFLMAKGTACVG